MKILIYREDLFVPSETFVWQQNNYPGEVDIRYSGMRLATPAGSRSYTLAVPRKSARLRRCVFRQFGLSTRSFLKALNDSDVVHCHFAIDAASLLPVLERVSRPLVVSLHGYDVLRSDAALLRTGIRGRYLVSRRRALIGRASLFLCSSRFVLEQAVRVGYSEDKCVLHYLGVPLAELQAMRTVEPAIPLLVYAGRFVENKGIDQLPHVSMHLLSLGIRHRMQVVGAGPLEASLRATIMRNRLPIEVLPHLPQKQLHDLVAHATAVLVPSRQISTGESEALNLVAVEATAMGVPVVANATGGLSEVVVDGVTGLLADPERPRHFATRVEEILGDANLRQSIRARDQDMSTFDRGLSRRRLLKLYEAVQ